MVLKSGYLALALKLQEATEKSPDKFKEKLTAALAAETEPGPWKDFLEAGARHSASDMGHLQAIHDASMVLGATCGGLSEAAKPGEVAKESAAGTAAPLRLIESHGACFLEEIPLRESAGVRTNYPIKIIDPGTGTTAHYDADVLKRESGKFKPGTLMFWNHPTSAEEAARPEGNLDHLAAITTSQGVWKDNGPKGPGIYAEAKVMADYAEKVAERAPHIGLSIRAGGERDGNKTVGGKPVLKEFSYIESVDYVTKAGRGGLALAEAARDAGILTEAAKPANPIQEAASMTAEEVQRLVEAGIRTSRLPEDARQEATRLLETVALKNETKAYIVETVLRGTIPTKEGALDKDALAPLVVAEAQRVGKLIAAESGGSQVRGMGIGAPIPAPKPEEIAAREAASKRELEEDLEIWKSLGLTENAAKHAAKGRAA